MTDINLNEDGVPLDEKDIERIWQDYANKCGLYTTHIENIGVSLPDLLIIWKGVTFFHEMKLQRGNLIYFQNYQWANFARMRHSLHPWQLSVVVWKDGIFKVFSVEQLKACEAVPAGHGKVKLSIAFVEPLFTVSNSYEYDLYLEYLRSKIWKKKN